MNEADFKSAYITQFLATHMASRYAEDCVSGHAGEPYNHQPVEDAAFLADCAWEQINSHVEASKSVRSFSLPDSHRAVLEKEAAALDLTPGQALAQAVRLYQMVNVKARAGLQLAFTDAQGRLVREPGAGVPALD